MATEPTVPIERLTNVVIGREALDAELVRVFRRYMTSPNDANDHLYEEYGAFRRTQLWTVEGQQCLVSLCRMTYPMQPNQDSDVSIIPVDVKVRQSWDNAQATLRGRSNASLIVAYSKDKVAAEEWAVPPLEMAMWCWSRGFEYTQCIAPTDEDLLKLIEAAVSIQWGVRMQREKRLLDAQRQQAVDYQVRQQQKKRERSAFARMYTAFFSFLYDMFQLAIATMDVITDIWVAIQYYQQGQMTFFYIGLVDIIIAQMCYTAFFVYMFMRYSRWRRRIWFFICILPFGQLIPLAIYIESHNFKIVSRIFQYFDFREFHDTHVDPNEDPFMAYLKKKFMAHMGFYLESLVEAIPQSILQMVGIVVTGQVTTINVLSIAISIFSVAAKGMMISYSIHRPTFVFSFLCIIYDVFSVFTTVSWLFFVVPNDPYPQVEVFYFSGARNVFTAIWFWNKGIFVLICAVWTVVMYFYQFFHLTGVDCCPNPHGRHINYRDYDREQIFPLILCWFGGCFVFLPVMIVMEGMKFAPLPLIVFRSFDSPHGRQMPFYSAAFNFLSTGDFREKVYAANQATSQTILRTQNRPNVDDNNRNDHWVRRQTLLFDAAEYSVNTPFKEYSLSALRDRAGYSVKAFLQSYKAAATENGRRLQSRLQKMENALAVAITHFIGPLWLISNIYSLLYPFLCLFTLNWDVPAALQRSFSIVLLVFLFIMLVLSKSVVRFRRSVTHLMMYDQYYIDMNTLDQIYRQYDLLQRQKEAVRSSGKALQVNIPRLNIVPNEKYTQEDFELFKTWFRATRGRFNMYMYGRDYDCDDPYAPGYNNPPPPDGDVRFIDQDDPATKPTERIVYVQPAAPVLPNVPPPLQKPRRPPGIKIHIPTPEPTAALNPVSLSPTAIPRDAIGDENPFHSSYLGPLLNELLLSVPRIRALATPLGLVQRRFDAFHESLSISDDEGDVVDAAAVERRRARKAAAQASASVAPAPAATTAQPVRAAPTVDGGAGVGLAAAPAPDKKSRSSASSDDDFSFSSTQA